MRELSRYAYTYNLTGLRRRHLVKLISLQERTGSIGNIEAAITGSTSGTSGIGRAGTMSDRREEPESDVNQEHLRQLMDMGFSRAHCIEALSHTLTVEQATDYLLTNPATLRRSVCKKKSYQCSPFLDK